MKTIIYYLCKKDRIPFYVGKTNNINDRKYKHRRKYGSDTTMEILEEVDKDEWRFWEAYYISLFKSWGFKLTNQNNGGGGLTTVNFNKERNKKISIKTKGVSKAHKGKPFTEEHKAKIKAKRSHLIGRKNTWYILPVVQCDLKGNIIQEWESQTAAQIAFNKPKSDGIGAACRGKQKTAYGFIWKFKQI
jgi:hypothetical protein